MGEGSYNVLKGSTVAYGEATNKTGYNYKWGKHSNLSQYI